MQAFYTTHDWSQVREAEEEEACLGAAEEEEAYLGEVACSSFLVQAGDVDVVEAGLHPEEGLVGHLSIQVGI